MKSVWPRYLQMSLCAAAVCAFAAVNAQTAPPAAAATKAASPAAAQHEGHPHAAHKGEKQRHHRAAHKGEKHHHHHAQPAAQPQAPIVYPDGHVHELGKEHAGPHAGDPELDQYQRNALARCAVFRSDEDRRSCAARVRSKPASGSVETGGVLREFTEQVIIVPSEKMEHP